MVSNVENISVEESNEVCVANLMTIVTSVIMRVDIDTSGFHNCWNIIFAYVSVGCLETSATTEGVHNVVYSKNYVTENSMLRTKFMIRQAMNVHWHLGADYTIIYIDTLTEENFM